MLYICGKFKITDQRNLFKFIYKEFIQKAYHAYFSVQLGDQEKPWVPHVVYKTCVEHLRQWTQGSRKALKFGIPMIWREPKNHTDDCYFCAINLTGINKNKRKSFICPNLPSALRPVVHCDKNSHTCFQITA